MAVSLHIDEDVPKAVVTDGVRLQQGMRVCVCVCALWRGKGKGGKGVRDIGLHI